jgi:hypothetical protein
MLSVTALKMLGNKRWRYIYNGGTAEEIEYCLNCGRPINLDLYAIPAFSLNCYAST